MISDRLYKDIPENFEYSYPHSNIRITFTHGKCSILHQMSHVMRKPDFCICENKDADQLCGNRTADQRLCFRYTDSR